MSDTQGSFETGDKSERSAGTAPGYVDGAAKGGAGSGGPHGKNLTEVGPDEKFEGEGKKKGPGQGVGEKGDPSRLAEEQFVQRNSEGGMAGMPVQKGDVEEGTYDALSGDVEA